MYGISRSDIGDDPPLMDTAAVCSVDDSVDDNDEEKVRTLLGMNGFAVVCCVDRDRRTRNSRNSLQEDIITGYSYLKSEKRL